MFMVKHKTTGTIRIAYAVAGVMFLFYDDKCSFWFYEEIDLYEPLEG